MSENLQCPYCDEWLKVHNDDGFGYAWEDEIHEMECKHCEKMFVFTTQISFDYTPRKASRGNLPLHLEMTDGICAPTSSGGSATLCRNRSTGGGGRSVG